MFWLPIQYFAVFHVNNTDIVCFMKRRIQIAEISTGTRACVADPGCLSPIQIFSIPDPNFSIPDPSFFHPGFRIRIFPPSRIPDLHQRIYPVASKLSEIWSGLFIPDPDPGSRGQKGTRSRIPDRIRNTGPNCRHLIFMWFFFCAGGSYQLQRGPEHAPWRGGQGEEDQLYRKEGEGTRSTGRWLRWRERLVIRRCWKRDCVMRWFRLHFDMHGSIVGREWESRLVLKFLWSSHLKYRLLIWGLLCRVPVCWEWTRTFFLTIALVLQ